MTCVKSKFNYKGKFLFIPLIAGGIIISGWILSDVYLFNKTLDSEMVFKGHFIAIATFVLICAAMIHFNSHEWIC
jgi:cytochrome b subunit of formate dehydrogenase